MTAGTGPNHENEGFSAAILAGGIGKRLGVNKALLEIEGRTILDRIMEKMLEVFSSVLLVVKDEHSPLSGDYGPPVKVVADLMLDKGPLGGIYTALEHSQTPYVFVIACDMPYPNLELVRRLLSEAPGREAVVPRRGSYIEPLFAVYHRDTRHRVRRRLEADHLKIHDFIDELNVRYLDEKEISGCDPDFRSFFNINTPEDLKKAR